MHPFRAKLGALRLTTSLNFQFLIPYPLIETQLLFRPHVLSLLDDTFTLTIPPFTDSRERSPLAKSIQDVPAKPLAQLCFIDVTLAIIILVGNNHRGSPRPQKLYKKVNAPIAKWKSASMRWNCLTNEAISSTDLLPFTTMPIRTCDTHYAQTHH